MDKYLKNRFSDLDNMSIAQLEALRNAAIQEIDFYLKVLDDKNASSYKKSEIRESDFKYEEDKLEYIEYLLQEKSNHKSR